jgi:hypothetical protein
MDKKTCLDCGEVIIGRVDKKFCSDACRNSYNNAQNKDVTNFIRNVNNQLRRNRRILQELTPNDKARVNRSKLLEKGFDFNYFTQIYTTKTGNRYFFCYDYGYLELDNNDLALVHRKDNH